MINSKHYKTIVISDVHLGSEFSKVKEVTAFLKHTDSDMLILNGDIIDGWQLKKRGRYWVQDNTEFFKVLIKKAEDFGTKIIYIRGNHDDFLDKLVPFVLSDVLFVKNYTFISFGKKYYVTHGDVFDSVTSNMRWLAKLGDIGYTLLMHVNKLYNKFRSLRGLPYYSLSAKIKAKVKKAVSYISDFEEELVDLAKNKKCDGVICGHIHKPADRYIDGIHYLNSGDWLESLTALTEDEEGKWNIYRYKEEDFANDKGGE